MNKAHNIHQKSFPKSLYLRAALAHTMRVGERNSISFHYTSGRSRTHSTSGRKISNVAAIFEKTSSRSIVKIVVRCPLILCIDGMHKLISLNKIVVLHILASLTAHQQIFITVEVNFRVVGSGKAQKPWELDDALPIMHGNVMEKERSCREHSVHRPSTRPSSDRSCWAAEMPLNLLVLPEPHDRAKMSGGAIEALRETASFSG